MSARTSYGLAWRVADANPKTGRVIAAWPNSYVAAWSSCEGCNLRPDVAKVHDVDPCYAWDGNGSQALGSVLRGLRRARQEGSGRYSLAYALNHAPRLTRYARLGPVGEPADANRAELLEGVETLRGEGFGILGYTHFPHREDVDRDLKGILRASCDGVSAEWAARKAGWSTAMILPWDHQGPTFETVDGPNGVVCPAQLRDVTCNQCGLCDVAGKAAATPIGFIAHGSKARAARKRAGKPLPTAR
jgi:hypothetical protein